jgi:hypothetical protein
MINSLVAAQHALRNMPDNKFEAELCARKLINPCLAGAVSQFGRARMQRVAEFQRVRLNNCCVEPRTVFSNDEGATASSG